MIRRLALYSTAVLILTVPVPWTASPLAGQAGTISGVVVGARERPDGTESIVLEVGGDEGEAPGDGVAAVPGEPGGEGGADDAAEVDEIRVRVGEAVVDGLAGGMLPEGWTVELDGGTLVFSGEPRPTPVRLRVDVSGTPPAAVDVVAMSDGRPVFESRGHPIDRLSPVDASGNLQDLLTMPSEVFPGGDLRIEVPEQLLSGWPDHFWVVAGRPVRPVLGAAGTPLVRTALPGSLPLTGSTIELRDKYGDLVASSPIVIGYGGPDAIGIVPPPAGMLEPTPSLAAASRRVFRVNPLCVRGWAPRLTDWNDLSLGGRPLGAPVTATNTHARFRIPEGIEAGRHTLTGPAFGAAREVEVMDLTASIDQDELYTGEGTGLHVQVLGTRDPVAISFRNRSTGIIEFVQPAGPVAVVNSSGGERNVASLTIRGISPGPFNVDYKAEEGDCPQGEGDGSLWGQATGTAPAAGPQRLLDQLSTIADEGGESPLLSCGLPAPTLPGSPPAGDREKPGTDPVRDAASEADPDQLQDAAKGLGDMLHDPVELGKKALEERLGRELSVYESVNYELFAARRGLGPSESADAFLRDERLAVVGQVQAGLEREFGRGLRLDERLDLLLLYDEIMREADEIPDLEEMRGLLDGTWKTLNVDVPEAPDEDRPEERGREAEQGKGAEAEPRSPGEAKRAVEEREEWRREQNRAVETVHRRLERDLGRELDDVEVYALRGLFLRLVEEAYSRGETDSAQMIPQDIAARMYFRWPFWRRTFLGLPPEGQSKEAEQPKAPAPAPERDPDEPDIVLEADPNDVPDDGWAAATPYICDLDALPWIDSWVSDPGPPPMAEHPWVSDPGPGHHEESKEELRDRLLRELYERLRRLFFPTEPATPPWDLEDEAEEGAGDTEPPRDVL